MDVKRAPEGMASIKTVGELDRYTENRPKDGLPTDCCKVEFGGIYCPPPLGA